MIPDEITVASHMDARVFTDFSNFNSFRLKNRWLGLTGFPVLMIGLGVINYLTGSTLLFWIFSSLGIILPLGYMIFYRISLRNQIKANQLETPRLVYTVTISKRGVEVVNQKERATVRWKQVYRVFVRKNAVYIYITEGRAFILPEADLPEGCTMQDLVDLIRAHIDNIRVFDKRPRAMRQGGRA